MTYRGHPVLSATHREIVLASTDDIQAVHKQIYAVIAEEYNLLPRSVESNIRTLSDVTWKIGRARLVRIAGYPLDSRPLPCVRFISNYTQRNYMNEEIHT